MKSALYILSIVLLISIVNAHGNHGGAPPPHYGGLRPVHTDRILARDACTFVSSNHQRYNLHLFNTWIPGDLDVTDPKTGTTLLFNPCGKVHDSACGENSTICLVSANGKAVSYASAHSYLSTLLPASSPNTPPSIEVMFGQGELCSTGVARKAVVTYTCKHLDAISHNFNNYKFINPIQSAKVDECFVSINIESPFACPVSEYCANIHSSKDCDSQPTCGWMFGKCQQYGVIFGVEIGLTIFMVMASLGCLIFCCCGVCMYMVIKKKSRSNKNKKVVVAKKSRKVSQKKRKAEGVVGMEMESFETPYHLVPGGFVAVEEYSPVDV